MALAMPACDGRRIVAGDAAQLSLTVRVSVPTSLAAAAARLGWTGEGVPGAVVVLTRLTPPSTPPDTGLADSLGLARFRNLTTGSYSVAVSRTLSDAEVARAGDALGGSAAFTSVITTALGDEDEQSLTVRLAPIDRGALLFSEFAPLVQQNLARQLFYYYSNYFRVYNNSDTTISLADKLFFSAFPNWWDFSSANPVNSCATLAPLMRDASGIWAQLIYRFPRDSRTLRPGEAALVVTDAIDHRSIAPGEPGFYDFSRADFEFIGGSDVDNPAVPNILSMGPRNMDVTGHGWHAYEASPIYGLAQPLNLDTLPKQYNSVWAAGSNFVRIPNGALLDVLSASRTQPSAYPACLPSILPTLDEEAAKVLPGAGPFSLHRRIARTFSNGRVILQRSRNSAADWFLGSMTPFVVP
ncbi:MAG: DUF4876 domain-containing protein [Gemmatimonadota bacterium]